MKDIRITDLPPEKLQARLRQKDDYKKIDLGGAREFYIGGLTYDFADEAGVDFADVLGTLETLGEKAQDHSEEENILGSEEAQKYLNTLSWFVYLGIKPFEPDLTPAEVKFDISGLDKEGVTRLMKSIAPEEAPEDGRPLDDEEASRPASQSDASVNGATASVETTGEASG